MSTSPPRSEPPRYRARRASRGWRPCSFALNRALREDRPDTSRARAPRGRGTRPPSDRRSCTHSSGRTTVTFPRRRRRAWRRGRRPAGRREGTGAYEKGTRKPEGSRRYTTPPPWCTSAPGTSVPYPVRRCAQPSTAGTGTEVPLLLSGGRHSVRATPPRDRTGRYLGRRSRTWKRSPASRRFETGDPVPRHEPSNWSSANRPGDRRGGSAHPHSSASWSPSDIGGRSRVSGAARGVPVTHRVCPPDDAAAIEIALDDTSRVHEVRVMVDRPRHPVDVGRLERRDLAERVVVELAERHHRRLGHFERRCRCTAEVAEPVALERPCRRRRAEGLAPHDARPLRRLTTEGCPAGAVARGLVAWLIDAAHVHATRDGARRFRRRRTSASPLLARVKRGFAA